jgi:hypothetical protein
MEILLELLFDLLKGLLIYFLSRAVEDWLGELSRYLDDYGTPQCA